MRRIHPTLLTDRGLVAAVEARAQRMPIPVRVDSTADARSDRLPADIEGAAYFAVSECLTNSLKHAGAAEAAVRIRRHDGQLCIEVSDNGHGFDTTVNGGTGLVGLRDRIEALGGMFKVLSDTTGTRADIRLPAAQ
ncbi:sensor histidine kinase [Rathayibacter soli]|uniref:sensor histidine kinase n=1 Tax=Rathayibacter soli TaxID=3144168 RepID=UPI0027E58072|nr:ATP-binding protein [Glaciibacter superstes]